MICPSSEDFVSHNRLRPLGNMICPSLEDFVAYNGLRPVGNMICPSLEDFDMYNGLRSLSNMISSKIEHDKNQWHIENSTKKRCITNTQRPNTTRVVLESDRHIDNDLLNLNGLKILGGRFSLWWTKRWWWIGFRLCLIEITMSIQKSEDLWRNTRSWIFVLR